MAKTRLNVSGMTCGGCVNSVTKALHGKPGVEAFDIQLDTGLVDIDYDAALTDPHRLAALIDAAGFEVSAPNSAAN